MISDIILWFGGIIVLIGAIGLLRFPDFYTRTHAATVSGVGGFTIVLLGIIIQNPSGAYITKILLLIFTNLLINPTTTHALADSAYRLGIKPYGLVKNDSKGGRK